MKKLTGILLLQVLIVGFIYGQKVSLAGEWRFKEDALDKSAEEKWFSKN